MSWTGPSESAAAYCASVGQPDDVYDIDFSEFEREEEAPAMSRPNPNYYGQPMPVQSPHIYAGPWAQAGQYPSMGQSYAWIQPYPSAYPSTSLPYPPPSSSSYALPYPQPLPYATSGHQSYSPSTAYPLPIPISLPSASSTGAPSFALSPPPTNPSPHGSQPPPSSLAAPPPPPTTTTVLPLPTPTPTPTPLPASSSSSSLSPSPSPHASSSPLSMTPSPTSPGEQRAGLQRTLTPPIERSVFHRFAGAVQSGARKFSQLIGSLSGDYTSEEQIRSEFSLADSEQIEQMFSCELMHANKPVSGYVYLTTSYVCFRPALSPGWKTVPNVQISYADVLSISTANALPDSSRVIPVIVTNANPFTSDSLQLFVVQNRLYQFCRCPLDQFARIFQHLSTLWMIATRPRSQSLSLTCPDCGDVVFLNALSQHICRPSKPSVRH